jgi:hypothetical protein
MGGCDISAKIRTAALTVIEAGCLGEDFGFDCTPMIAPGPDGKPMAVYVLTLTKRSPLLGQGPLLNLSQISSPDPSVADVEKAVTDGMRGLRELSSKLLSGQNGHAKLALS